MRDLKNNIRYLKGFFAIMIGSLIIYLSYFIVFDSDAISINDYNPRLSQIEASVLRGKIITADGTVIASSKINEAKEQIRSYPYNQVYAQPIGSSIGEKYGLEALLNTELLSTHQPFYQQLNPFNQGIKEGATVTVTLNHPLQTEAYALMENKMGGLIISDYTTGAIKALVSTPSGDPNKAIEKEALNEEDGILLNRVTQGLYGVTDVWHLLYMLNNELGGAYFCTGEAFEGETKISCSNEDGHGREDVFDAYVNNCQLFFRAQDVLTLGEEPESRYGFRNLTIRGLAINENRDKDGSNYTINENMQNRLNQLYTTPLYSHMLYSALANGGTLNKPTLIQTIQSTNLNYKIESQTEVLSQGLFSLDEYSKVIALWKESGNNSEPIYYHIVVQDQKTNHLFQLTAINPLNSKIMTVVIEDSVTLDQETLKQFLSLIQ